ncbi:MAG: hypothetical protein ACI31S_01125 [Bacilli bacterium]
MERSREREELLKNIALLYQDAPEPDDRLISNYINLSNSTSENLLGTQTKIRNNYIKEEKKNKLKIAPYPNFLVIDTPNSEGRYTNTFTMDDGIKIYIPVDSSKMYKVATSILDFIIKKKIPAQFKMRNILANDALTIRCSSKEDIDQIIEYINKKIIKDINTSKINPFIPVVEGINACVDGQVSYNRVLARLLDSYLYDKKLSGTITNVSVKEFSDFVGKEINNLQSRNWHYYFLLYKINNMRMYQDFILVASMIKDNINTKVSLDDIENYQKAKKFKPGDKFEYSSKEMEEIKKKALREILIYLKNFYDADDSINNSIEYLHRVMMEYISMNNLKGFTRNNKVRNVINRYYPNDIFKKYVTEMGYDTLINVALETKLKYGNDQLKGALCKLMKEGKLSGFTNEKGLRSELGFIIPSDLLVETLKISTINGRNLFEDIIVEEPKRGRK